VREADGNLHISYLVQMTPRTIARYQGINITPGIETDNAVLLLPTFTVVGRNRNRVLTRFYRNTGQEQPDFDIDWLDSYSFIYNVRVPLQSWMQNARLSIRQEILGHRGHSVNTHFLTNERVLFAQQQQQVPVQLPYQVQPQVTIREPERQEKIVQMHATAFLDFPQGISTIRPNYRRNPIELNRIRESVLRVINDPDVEVQSIYIRGFASPEGSWESNNRLARARAIAVRNYIRDNFFFPEGIFRVSSYAEDWDGLAEKVRNSNLPQREMILHIINSVGIFEGRESALMRLDGGVPYRIMYRDMFPYLRRIEYQINYRVRDFSVQESMNRINTQPETLSHLEMFRVAENYGKESDRANGIMTETIPRHFPDDETANLNAAALLIQRGELTAARLHLDRAGNGSAALNNRGVIALLTGNFEQANDYFNRAQAAGSSEAMHNRNEVARLNGNKNSLGNN
jgi:outer membrane protein OmpA-like peptidoglycan-associated protein